MEEKNQLMEGRISQLKRESGNVMEKTGNRREISGNGSEKTCNGRDNKALE
jgi:hypothetical protein